MKKPKTSRVRAATVTLILGFLLPAVVHAQAPAKAAVSNEPTSLNPAAAVFDVLIVRPLGLAVLPVGVAAFIPAALLAAPSGTDNLRAALELFVTSPAAYVFTRPLGDF